jgi:hypothetical protein
MVFHEAADDAVDEPTDDSPIEHTEAEQTSDARRGRQAKWIRRSILGGLGVVVVVLGVFVGPTTLAVIEERNPTLKTPDELVGFVRADGDGAKDTAEYIRDAVASSAGLTKSLGAVYKDPTSTDKSLMFVGGTATFWRPGDSLTEAFGIITDDSGGVKGVHDVPAGDLGGVMRCGTTPTDNNEELPVCGWADHGSIGVALFLGHTLSDAEAMIKQIRPAVEHRS